MPISSRPHVAEVIRAMMPKLGLVEPSPVVPLVPAETLARLRTV